MFLYNLDCSDLGQWPSWPVVPHNHRVTLRSRNGAISAQKIHRSNVPADTPSEYYCHTISIPVLDHLLSELGARFGSHQRTALQGLSIVPSVAVSFELDDYASRLKALCDLYENDLPSPQSFESELNCWLMKWKHKLENHGENSLPTCKSLILTLRHIQ